MRPSIETINLAFKSSTEYLGIKKAEFIELEPNYSNPMGRTLGIRLPLINISRSYDSEGEVMQYIAEALTKEVMCLDSSKYVADINDKHKKELDEKDIKIEEIKKQLVEAKAIIRYLENKNG